MSEYVIKKALKLIDEKNYKATLYKLYEQKAKQLASEKNQFTKKRKLQDYLLQKGYERPLIAELLR